MLSDAEDERMNERGSLLGFKGLLIQRRSLHPGEFKGSYSHLPVLFPAHPHHSGILLLSPGPWSRFSPLSQLLTSMDVHRILL